MRSLDIITLKCLRDRRQKQVSHAEHKANLDFINSTYHRVFNTDDGKFVLEHLVKMHLIGSIAEQGDNLLDIGVKQGSANLVKEIVQRIEIAKDGS